MIPRRVVVLVIAIVAVLAAAITGYIYLASLSSVNSGAKPVVTTINIPEGSYIEPSGRSLGGCSYIEPSGFNLTKFQTEFATGAYPYLVNITVTIGINNTIECVNKDTQ